MNKYYPENYLIHTDENKKILQSVAGIREAFRTEKVIEARATSYDKDHNLCVDLGAMKGIIPKTEAAINIDGGSVKDIAIISRVNKPVVCKVTGFFNDKNGETVAILSRKAVQLECKEEYISTLTPGCIIDAVVTRTESFGAFCDIGAGLIALMPIDCISISRIPHPSARFAPGDKIKAVVKSINEHGQISLTYKELLGTFEENAALFEEGEVVSGIVRSVNKFGIFIELKPNLVGLIDYAPGVSVGQQASVFIKSIIPQSMKIKLSLVESFNEKYPPEPVTYYYDSDSNFIDRWVYTPDNCEKRIETVFSP